MIVDRLVLHHTYAGPSAFDISQNHHHGRLESVTSGGGRVKFRGGPDTVRVLRTPTLDTMRAVRTTVRFNRHSMMTSDAPGFEPWAIPPRRMNLIEGYRSFALVVNADMSIQGTVRTSPGVWAGARSAPDTVTADAWHEATFVYDGFSACRVVLDGVTVAEAHDVIGPVNPPDDPYGIAIGHWPDPDDRYTLVGDIAEVRVWIDRLDTDDLVDECCIDRGSIDGLFEDVRGLGSEEREFDPAVYEHAVDEMRRIGATNFGHLAAGDETDRAAAWDLARRFSLGLQGGHRGSLVDTVLTAGTELSSRRSAADLQADAAALSTALQGTPLQPLMTALLSGASPTKLEGLAAGAGLDEWVSAFCFDWAVPDGPRDRPAHGKKPRRPSRDRRDPTDRNPREQPPGWGDGPPHSNGADQQPKQPESKPDEGSASGSAAEPYDVAPDAADGSDCGETKGDHDDRDH